MLGYGDAASNAVKTLALNPEAGPGLQVIHQIHHHAGQLWYSTLTKRWSVLLEKSQHLGAHMPIAPLVG